MVRRYVPEAGDVIWVDFSPTRGHEQAGKRPAVVISVRAYAGVSGLCTVCPITSQSKGYINEVPIITKNITGVVLIDQHKTIDVYARTLKRVAKVNIATLKDIRTRIGLILGIAG
ncbi:MAG: type II toxin-antitoxin system PemK/MazF family toxin [bacterium]|nr:type II toxin-antitoxin system PemK/MazF family toxin [bacterium]